MNVFHYPYRSKETLLFFIKENNLTNGSHILVLISGGRKPEMDLLENWLKESMPLPPAIFRDAFTDAEQSKETIVSFFLFSHEVKLPKDENASLILALLKELAQKDLEASNAVNDQQHTAEINALFCHNPNLIIKLDEVGNMTSFNRETERQLGYGKSDLYGQSALDFIYMADRDRARLYFKKAATGQPATSIIDVCDRGGRQHPYEVTLIPLLINGEVKSYFVVGINKTTEREAENKLTHLAYHDALTGLANRFLFEQSLNYLIKHADKQKENLAVLFLDLDRFKLINDTSGHFVGDRILQQAVERIKSVLSPHHVLARFEGDKFSIIYPHLDSQESVAELARQIQMAFEPPFIFEENEYFLSVSMGVSFYPTDGINDEQLMKNADIALFSAKSISQSSVVYYTEQMNSVFSDRVEFESYLRKALKKEEFLLYYQPQISIENGQLSGCEALIRWDHPKLGLVQPIHFIPLAEEIGLIEEIGLWVLETACQQVKAWQEKGLAPFPISINVSFRQFLRKDFVEQVYYIIKKEKIDPKWIHLEITESTTVQDLQYSIALVKELKRIGVSVSLDDFGTGYSALSVLKDFTLDILKIDRSFIRNLSDVDEDRAIVKAIIMMCKGLRLKVIAEGVETEAQIELLKSFGCEVAQGYFYSKPVPSKLFEAKFLKAVSG